MCTARTSESLMSRTKRVPKLGEKSLNKTQKRFPRSSSLYLCQRRLGLKQPERHLHSAVHLVGREQRGAGLLPLASRVIQRTEAAVAVRLERAHAQLLGEGQSLLVVGASWFDLRGLVMHGDVAEEVERPGLVASLPVHVGELVRL